MSASLASPDATVANTGTVTGAGGDADLALRDGDDATFVTLMPGELILCTFGAPSPSLAAGSMVVRNDLIVRTFATAGAVLKANIANADAGEERSSVPPNVLRTWVPVSLVGDYDPGSASFALTNTGSWVIAVYGVSLATYWATKPVTNVTAPTGTLTEDNRPTITWANTLDAVGGAQFSADVKVFTDAQYGAGGFDPDDSDAYLSTQIIGQETSHQFQEALEDDTYRVYVQVRQFPNFLAEHESDWNYEQIVVNVPQPGLPTITATAEPTATPAARVKLELADSAGETATEHFQVQRKVGDLWENIRTVAGGGLVDGDGATIYDYFVPVDETLTYRARAVADLTNGTSYSDWTADETATLSPTSWSLIHPTRPSLSENVTLRSLSGHDRGARQTVKQPVGRSDAVVISDTRLAESGQIVFRLADDATRDAIMGLAGLEVPLLLRPASGHHERSRWIVLGDESITRVVDKSWLDERDGSYSWTEVAEVTDDLAAWE